jgi:hypothetical protein
MAALLKDDFTTLTECTQGIQALLIARVARDY